MITIENKRLGRLYSYLIYLKHLKKRNRDYVSTEKMAKELNLKTNAVRADLEFIDERYSALEIHKTSHLLQDLEKTLGYIHPFEVVMVGDPVSIKAASESQELKDRGISVVACFTDNGYSSFMEGVQYELLPISKLEEMIDRMDIKMAVVAANDKNENYFLDRLSSTSIKSIIRFGNNQNGSVNNIILESIKE
ncbi:MAG: winged-helix domain-containing protein [Bacteroidales bacterium]|nr:winged-helix domain-containing protein [Bacteroidales bacterium]